MPTTREHSLNILDRFWVAGKQLKNVQKEYFKKCKISGSDRRRITVITNDVLRWKGRLDLWIALALKRPFHSLQPKLLSILEIGTYELLLDKGTPAYAAIDSAVSLARKRVGKHTTGLVNAVLRKVSRFEPEIPPLTDMSDEQTAAWYATPKWLYDRWVERFGETKTQSLCTRFNTPPETVIRRNPLRIEHGEFVAGLESRGVSPERINGSDRFYRVMSGSANLRTEPLFLDGCFSYQDRGAGAVVELLDPRPGETVLDVCAAPGTKALYIAERMEDKGTVWASDVSPKRVESGKRDQDRHRMRIIKWEVRDATADTFPRADRILVDAPCTGTGVIGRRPDIKWRRRPEHLAEMSDLQINILNHVSRYLRPNGVLVYATCSLEPEENWQVVEAFLKLNDNFRVDPVDDSRLKSWITRKMTLETFPPDDHIDGMFAVRLRLVA